ncbi:HGL272Wp [Eremothecium sinecaudum]|uniref:Large ribosomal subunit protein uL29m n=1 Tax=Eremothecium sinecaudum TaxID=45286 RepID=A0A109V0A9_9SACH|nr:HGL272Wp [Eremothecium sinecaudum]AMD22068.1 HGL272Wp [Eremothecium sinecaudum]
MAGATRSFHNFACALARTKYSQPKPKPPPRTNVRLPTQLTHHDADLKVTAPIPPSSKNLKVPEDHPLWQFFSNRKYMRTKNELDVNSRPWSIPELRRKSFDDLHSLWYNCLKERNILARENHLWKNAMEGRADIYGPVDQNIRTTMWRIRHVLSERDWSFRNAKEESENIRATLTEEFESDFLSEENEESAFDMLTRFQYAVYGISEYIDENTVDRDFVDGIKHIATLKLRKFAPLDSEIKDLLMTSESKITDAGEAFVLFTAENNLKAMQEASTAVKELRESGNSVSRYDELNTVAEYMKRLANAQASV